MSSSIKPQVPSSHGGFVAGRGVIAARDIKPYQTVLVDTAAMIGEISYI